LAQSYRDLLVWQKAMQLCKHVYDLTPSLPSDERFGLTSQIKRSAVSIPSNIAEGRSRRTTGDYLRHLDYSYGSMAELETQLLIAQQNQWLTSDVLQPIFALCTEISKMLNGLISSLESPKS
jgi:four helix bundle protein